MADINLKLDNMRKADNFTIYPFKKGDTTVIIQSKNRIGQFDVTTGVGVLNHKAGGAYFMHLSKVMGAKAYTLAPVDLQAIKLLIFADGNQIVIGGGMLVADNSGAASILAF